MNAELKYDANGLIPAVVQQHDTGENEPSIVVLHVGEPAHTLVRFRIALTTRYKNSATHAKKVSAPHRNADPRENPFCNASR